MPRCLVSHFESFSKLRASQTAARALRTVARPASLPGFDERPKRSHVRAIRLLLPSVPDRAGAPPLWHDRHYPMSTSSFLRVAAGRFLLARFCENFSWLEKAASARDRVHLCHRSERHDCKHGSDINALGYRTQEKKALA